MMYLNSIRGGGIFAQFIRNKLAHKYGIYIHPSAKIGLGLKIYHPTSIVITSAEIGKDFTIYQNCTIGRKGNDTGDDVMPKIGNNVKMFSGSCIIGGITVCDNVILAANACLVKNASESGVYAGVPAKKIK